MKTRVLLVDDLQLFREGFRALLHNHEKLEWAGESCGAPEAYGELERVKPDVAVISAQMSGVSGPAVARELLRRQPGSRVLMLAMRREDDAVRQAFSAGARGFALKQQSASEIFEAIDVVAKGHSYLAPGIAQVVLDDALRLRRGREGAQGPCDSLSAREREVFDLLIRGNTTQQIARLLCISGKTVETHRARVFQKIGVHSLVDLVRFAARNQLPLD